MLLPGYAPVSETPIQLGGRWPLKQSRKAWKNARVSWRHVVQGSDSGFKRNGGKIWEALVLHFGDSWSHPFVGEFGGYYWQLVSLPYYDLVICVSLSMIHVIVSMICIPIPSDLRVLTLQLDEVCGECRSDLCKWMVCFVEVVGYFVVASCIFSMLDPNKSWEHGLEKIYLENTKPVLHK